MKTRPFGSVAWGMAVTLAIGVIFAVSTSLYFSMSSAPAPRDAAGSNLRLARLAGGLANLSTPALAMGRFVSSGQADDMRTYLNGMTSLQADVRAIAATFAGDQRVGDQLNQLDQQIVRAIGTGRQVAAQPGSGLLNAGGPGSAEQIGAATLASVKASLEDLLKIETDRTPAALQPQLPNEKPEFRVWLGGWGALAGLMAVLLLITALRPEAESVVAAATQPQAARAASADRPKPAAQEGGMLASVARQLELAHLDNLTGLLNRQALAPTVEKAIEWSLRKGVTIGMIYVEVDGFKALREQLGPSLANALIIEVGKQLKETFRRGDEVARLRDAEFAVVVTEISGREILTRLEERIQEAIADLRMPTLHGRRIKANIGLAMYPIDGYSDRDLLETARNAVLYRAGVVPPALPEAVAEPLKVEPVAAPAAIAAPPTEPAPEAPAESVEMQVDASLAQLYTQIGKYLQAEHGSADKHAQAQLLIGEFQRRA